MPAIQRLPVDPRVPLLVVGAVLLLLSVVALSALAYSTVVRTWKGLPQSTPAAQVGLPSVLQPSATPTLSVAQPLYLVGAWMSDSNPQPSSTVTVFVRITASANAAPVAGVSVTVSAQFTCRGSGRWGNYGPANTGSDGMAALSITLAALPAGEPVCITASATIGGQPYTASTTFTAAVEVLPTPTVEASPQDYPLATPPVIPTPKKWPKP